MNIHETSGHRQEEWQDGVAAHPLFIAPSILPFPPPEHMYKLTGTHVKDLWRPFFLVREQLPDGEKRQMSSKALEPIR